MNNYIQCEHCGGWFVVSRSDTAGNFPAPHQGTKQKTQLDDIRERTQGHTPGPWRAQGDNTVQEGTRADWVVWAEAPPYLGQIGYYWKQNAELIAAAPDLLRIATEQARRIEPLEQAVSGYRSLAQSREAEIEQYDWLLDQAKTRVEALEAALEWIAGRWHVPEYIYRKATAALATSKEDSDALAGDTKTGTELCQEDSAALDSANDVHPNASPGQEDSDAT